MSTRHLIAYCLLAALIAAIGILLAVWQRNRVQDGRKRSGRSRWKHPPRGR